MCHLRSDHDRPGGYVCCWGRSRAREVLALPNASEVLQALEVLRAVEAYEPKKRVARAADGYF